MGVAFYPTFSGDNEDWPNDMNSKCLARATDIFDKVAKKARVSILNGFYSMTREEMICELLDGDPDDPTTYDESKIPDVNWHDPADGLRTLNVLIDYVQSDGKGIKDPGFVLDDLQAFKRHLENAQEKGLLWHLVIDA